MEQRGACKRYRYLFMGAVKVALPTTDSNPQVLMTGSVLQRLYDTASYIEESGMPPASAEIEKPPKKKQRKKTGVKGATKDGDKPMTTKAEDQKHGKSRQPLNKLDIIERRVEDATVRITSANIRIKFDILTMARHRLIEFVRPGSTMEILGVGTQTGKTTEDLGARVLALPEGRMGLSRHRGKLRLRRQPRHSRRPEAN